MSEYIKTCEQCQRIKARRNIPKPPLKPIIAAHPLERIEIDFTEFDYPDPVTGDRYLLTVIDCFSKFGWTKTFKSKHAAPVAKFLFEEIHLREGQIDIIQSDNGSEFIASITQEFIKLAKADNKRSRAKHPQTNGQIERLNGTFKQMLNSSIKKQKNVQWSVRVPVIMNKYNRKYHSTIGRSPFEAFRPLIAYNISKLYKFINPSLISLTCVTSEDASEDQKIAFLSKVNQQVREAQLASSKKNIKQFEKRYKIRVYGVGDTVLVDKGKRSGVNKEQYKIPAVVEKGIAGGFYQVYLLDGPDVGESEYVDVDRIEELNLRPDSKYLPIVEDIREGRKKIEKLPLPTSGPKASSKIKLIC